MFEEATALPSTDADSIDSGEYEEIGAEKRNSTIGKLEHLIFTKQSTIACLFQKLISKKFYLTQPTIAVAIATINTKTSKTKCKNKNNQEGKGENQNKIMKNEIS